MYEHHFGLNKPPFRITPDPEFFFPGANRGAVLEALVYAISRGEGMVKVVGEVGSGKTMLCRMLERELPAHCEIVYLANPRLGADEILHAIAFELGLTVELVDTRLKVLHALHQYLLDRHANNKRVVMFIEEAQSVPVETLEEIRLLSNLETTQEKLLQIVLFGQPELDDKLDLHEIRQLRERITHAFELKPLSSAELRDYVTSRVRASGFRGNDLFSAGALRLLERHSQGLLRRINILADKALLAAFAESATQVAPAHVKRAAADSEFARLPPAPRTRPVFVVLLLVAAALAAWLSARQDFFPQSATAPAAVTHATPPATSLATEPVLAVSEPPAAGTSEMQAGDGSRDGDYDAQRPLYPTVSPATGLVGIEHLRPVLDPPSVAPVAAAEGPATAP